MTRFSVYLRPRALLLAGSSRCKAGFLSVERFFRGHPEKVISQTLGASLDIWICFINHVSMGAMAALSCPYNGFIFSYIIQYDYFLFWY